MVQICTLRLSLSRWHCFGLDSTKVSDFRISAELAEDQHCGGVCQAILNPGDLLKLVPVNGSAVSVPHGVSVYKFQYTSTYLDGSAIPSTGFIALPYARISKPFKLIAYAHGTSGVFRGCAPSTSPSLFGYQSWRNKYTAHKYVASAANANDVYVFVVAAQRAFPRRLPQDWVSVGHSQGGGAAYKLSEHKLVRNATRGYLGGVAVAPVTKLYDQLLHGIEKLKHLDNIGDYYIQAVLPSASLGIKAVFPEYTFPLLSDIMKSRIELAQIAQLCDTSISGLTLGLRPHELFANINNTSDPLMEEFQKLNAPAQGDSASRPLLVVQGAADTIVFEEATVAAYNDSCRYGNSVRLSVYPGADHSAVLGSSAPDALGRVVRVRKGERSVSHLVQLRRTFN
ncbi:hypothetical protein BJY04DRAFT_208046 [Aspergillus karnatakaensis]|uniref:alpha/beta hydrolase family protein n=1 Tax=Aspergillus karnatakaensis TaxID=1810916 RepID=UPI003CCE2FB6